MTNLADDSEEALDQLLRRVAQTPDVMGVRRRIRPGTVLAGRFEVRGKVGEGGMGQVFSAHDRERDAPVAVKMVGKLTPRSVAQLKREFRVAAELVHPNLVRLHELFLDGIEWFFTMDLVEGLPLSSLLGEWRGSRPDAVRDVFRQLAMALSALHRAGSLHGDLKPSNFLIAAPDDPCEMRVVLLDFGLARPIGNSEDVGGTLAYMPPEQALGRGLTEAADWYSFGVVLYEALSGALPLRGPWGDKLAGAPDDLRALCVRLLQFRPDDRPSGREVLELLGVRPIGADMATMPSSSRAVLVGRAPQLQSLDEMLEDVVAGRPAMALVSGVAGIGKTVLVQHFLQIARKRGAVVLSGRCRERESMSYKALDGLVDELVVLLQGMDDPQARMLLPRDVADLVLLFPALRGAAVVADAPKRHLETTDQSLARQRAIGAFGELVRRVAAGGPLVVWIDDLQWSDRESALVLGPLLGGPDPVPLLFVGGYRSEQRGALPILDALHADRALTLPASREIVLGPLEADEAERMALELLPSAVADVHRMARNIGRDSGGHPLFISELAYTLRSPEAIHGEKVPANLADLIDQRVNALPADARSVLELAAVAGAPLSRSVLRQAQRLGASKAVQAFDALRASRLALSQGLRDDHAVDVRHDRIREIIVQKMSEEKRRQRHLNLAHVLEARGEGKAEALATHYEAGGDLARAAHHWLAAADEAMGALAFVHAADLYERGIAQASLDAVERRRFEIRRAEALAYAGNGAAAAEAFLATAVSASRDEALELRRRAAEQLLLSGRIEPGLAVLEQVLAAIGMTKTKSGRAALPGVVAGRLLVRARGLGHVARSEPELSREEIARLDASWTVAYSLGFVDFMRGADFQNRHLLLALRAGEPRRLLRALTLEAVHAATPGLGSERRTEEILRVANGLAANAPDEAAAGLLQLARGVAAYLHGRFDDGLRDCEGALDIFTTRCAGAVWERVTAQRFIIASLFFSGRLKRLASIVPPLLSQAEATGNRYATMCFRTAFSTTAWLVRDDANEARRQLDLARAEWKSSGFEISHCNLLIGETYVDFYSGDGERAAARMREQWPRLTRAQVLRIGALRVQLWQLRAASAAAAAAIAQSRGEHTRAAELRRDARLSAKALQRDRMARGEPMAALVEAALSAAEGQLAAAKMRLDSAADAFTRQGLRLFAAAAHARLGAVTGGDDGLALVERSLEELRAESISSPKRMLDLLAPGFGVRGSA